MFGGGASALLKKRALAADPSKAPPIGSNAAAGPGGNTGPSTDQPINTQQAAPQQINPTIAAAVEASTAKMAPKGPLGALPAAGEAPQGTGHGTGQLFDSQNPKGEIVQSAAPPKLEPNVLGMAPKGPLAGVANTPEAETPQAPQESAGPQEPAGPQVQDPEKVTYDPITGQPDETYTDKVWTDEGTDFTPATYEAMDVFQDAQYIPGNLDPTADIDKLYNDLTAQHEKDWGTQEGMLQKQQGAFMRQADITNARMGRGLGGGYASLAGAALGKSTEALANAKLQHDRAGREMQLAWLDRSLAAKNRASDIERSEKNRVQDINLAGNRYETDVNMRGQERIDLQNREDKRYYADVNRAGRTRTEDQNLQGRNRAADINRADEYRTGDINRQGQQRADDITRSNTQRADEQRRADAAREQGRAWVEKDQGTAKTAAEREQVMDLISSYIEAGEKVPQSLYDKMGMDSPAEEKASDWAKETGLDESQHAEYKDIYEEMFNKYMQQDFKDPEAAQEKAKKYALEALKRKS